MSSRCFSTHPVLLPHATEAIWFASPVADEDAQLTELEEAYKAQVRSLPWSVKYGHALSAYSELVDVVCS